MRPSSFISVTYRNGPNRAKKRPRVLLFLTILNACIVIIGRPRFPSPPSMGINLEVAQGVGCLFVESLFYGLYLPSLFFCLKCLLWDENQSAFRSAHSTHWIILLSALTLWVSGTLNLALGLLRSVRAFAQCAEPGTDVQLFDDVSDWVNVTRVCA